MAEPFPLVVVDVDDLIHEYACCLGAPSEKPRGSNRTVATLPTKANCVDHAAKLGAAQSALQCGEVPPEDLAIHLRVEVRDVLAPAACKVFIFRSLLMPLSNAIEDEVDPVILASVIVEGLIDSFNER